MKLLQLRYWRELKGLTQPELGQKAGVDAATISRLESRKRGAHPSTARKLATALKVEVEDLVTFGFEDTGSDNSESDSETVAGYPGVAGMVRIRRQAKQYGPEWAFERLETLAHSEPNRLKRNWLENSAREYERKAAKDRGEYKGNYHGYLVERLSEEILFQGDVRAALDALYDRYEHIPAEALDEVHQRADYIQKAIDAYHQQPNADQNT